LTGLVEWTEMLKDEVEKTKIESRDEHEQILQTSNPLKIFRNVQFKWNIE